MRASKPQLSSDNLSRLLHQQPLSINLQPAAPPPPSYREAIASEEKSAAPPIAAKEVVAAPKPRRRLLKSNDPEISKDMMALKQGLKKYQLEKHQARICIILDASESMQTKNKFYETNEEEPPIQKLINKAFTLAVAFDNNQEVELFPFHQEAFDPIILTSENYKDATQEVFRVLDCQLGGGTNYMAAVKKVREYYFKNSLELNEPQPCRDAPVFAIFVTDGEPSCDEIAAKNEFLSASHQAIFFKFIALKGCQEVDPEFEFLKSIDDAKVKSKEDKIAFFVDNSDLVTLKSPEDLTMDQLILEYRAWLTEAYQKNLLVHDPGVKYSEEDCR